MERTNHRKEEMTKILPVRYAGIRMYTYRKETDTYVCGDCGILLVYYRILYRSTYPGNLRAIFRDYGDIHKSRNANQEEQRLSRPRYQSPVTSKKIILFFLRCKNLIGCFADPSCPVCPTLPYRGHPFPDHCIFLCISSPLSTSMTVRDAG